jgi:hypothetical protein
MPRRLRCVLDTNVVIAADGRAGVRPKCVRECLRVVSQLMDDGHLFLDDLGLIESQYRKNIDVKAQPGLAVGFMRWLWTNKYNKSRCTITPLTRSDSPKAFEEFPEHKGLEKFDPSDRVFVAVSASHGRRPPILQGTDSKWWGWKEALAECGIKVRFLCPEIEKTYERKILHK